MYETDRAVERIAAARSAIDALDPTVMLVGRNENFRDPSMSVGASIARAVAYADAGADCLFVPFILDRGAVAELVSAVAPKLSTLSYTSTTGASGCSPNSAFVVAAWVAASPERPGRLSMPPR